MNLDSIEIAQGLFYLLLLVFLCLNIFSRRELTVAKTFKYIAIWSAIALVLIIGYSYRYELGAVKGRVVGELNPTSTQVNNNNQLVIYRSNNGHFYINSDINGHFVRFMVDTGASDTSIGINTAKKLGINTSNLIFNKRYQTANGVIFGATTHVKTLKIGNVLFKNVPISIANSNIKTPLLGVNILRQFRKYEVSQDQLILTP